MQQSPLRVNLGCGGLPLEGFVNVDKYADAADLRADVLAIHFEQVAEVHAYHLLEHLTHSDAAYLLQKAKAWMRSGGLLVVEVPDMEEILEQGTALSNWAVYIYGNDHEGEKHLWGYTLATLTELVQNAGWVVEEGRRFYSRESQRMNMPCIIVRARRP